ncbi:hypothetical protein [Aureimonas psammosilenae]|uniref:hypothetical protein n=1 Tax=Aureimonas psammosilenae TaxID=2495496 RepID=UPI0012612F16|nr:hypothetical protein [Aureimonas psammosilenae]
MRFLFNLLGGLLLAFALVFAVADIARSIADGVTRLTTLSEGAAAIGLQPLGSEAGLSGGGLDLVATLSSGPAAIMLGLLALLFLFIGRPPRRRAGRLAR